MKNSYLLLALTVLAFIAPSSKVVAQQKITTVNGFPVIIASEDGTYKICIEGIHSKSEAEMFLATLRKKGFKNNVVVAVSGLKKTPSGSSEKAAKIIHYGPWRMQNNLKIPSDNFVDFFNFISKGRKDAGGIPDKRKHIIKNKTYSPSIIELKQNAQVTVVKGQEYSVQVGAFTFDISAVATLRKISAIINLPVVVIIKDGFYHLLIEGFPSREDAKLFVDKLAQNGFKGTIVKVNSPVKLTQK